MRHGHGTHHNFTTFIEVANVKGRGKKPEPQLTQHECSVVLCIILPIVPK